MSHVFKNGAGERGESLVTVMVAVAIAGILAVIMMQQFSNHQKSQQALETRGEFEALRRQLMNSVSCPSTFDQPACEQSNPTPVKLIGMRKNGDLYEIKPKDKVKFTATCNLDADSGDPVLNVIATRRDMTRSLYIGCGEQINLAGAAGAAGAAGGSGAGGGAGAGGAAGTGGGPGGSGNDGTAGGNGLNGRNGKLEMAIDMCQTMGGVWDNDRKCLFVADNGGLVRRASSDAAKQEQVIGCDIKTSGGGSDMKTCNEAGTGKKSCVFKNGNWTYIKGKEKVCAGGIVVDTDK